MTATIITFPGFHYRPPDPRNGEVYATEIVDWCEVDGVEVGTPAGFGVVHMSASGGSASIEGGFNTLEEADTAARAQAQQRGAVYLEARE